MATSFYCGQPMQPVMVALLKFIPLISAPNSVSLESSANDKSALERFASGRLALERLAWSKSASVKKLR